MVEKKTAKQYQIPSLMPIVFFFSCIMFFLGYFHWSVFFHWHFLFCYAFCLYFPLRYVFPVDIFIGLCLPLLFSLVLCYLIFSFVIFSIIELCFLLVFSLVLCWSGNRLVPQLELLTSQPALTTTTYSLFLGKPGQIWHTTENKQCIWKNIFWQYFPLLNCFIGLILLYSIIQFSPPL